MSLFIFRRDFRINDNTALNECLKETSNIYPVFIFTPEQVKKNPYKSNNAVQFMCESLKELKKNINLTFLYGDYLLVIKDIVKNNNISKIYTNTDYTKYAIKRDKNIEKLCKELDIEFHCYDDILLHKPGTIMNSSGNYYQKFTPFYRECLKHKVNKPTSKKIKNDKYCKSKYKITNIDNFYKKNNDINVNGGRSNALKILRKIKNFKNYEKTRNTLSMETTLLSAYIKFGCVSIREVYNYFMKFGKNHPLIRQLIWRDFYYHMGYGYIDRFGYNLKEKYDNIKWKNSKSKFKLWCEGRTGYPIVDACMRELNISGYMHNRGRLIVSSFLIKNLGIDWRWGEKYFAQNLIDYDVLVNNGNWQWTSGGGADSQPYFRVFNPWLQSERYDKNCIYIKYWIPELENVDNNHIHKWYDYYDDSIYIKPIIDYKKSKEEILKMYKKGL